MLLETLAVIGALCVGAAAGQAILWLWGTDLRLVLIRKGPAAPPAPVASPNANPLTDDEFNIVHRWAMLNPWYEDDPQLNMEAQHIHLRLRQTCPDLSLEDNLAFVTQEMHARHPEIVPTRQ